MRIAVMGAGAVGCYYGGMLARAGHSVVLIGRARHIEAVRRFGLRLDVRSVKNRVPLDASTEAAAVEGARVVLFCVKSTDTEQAAHAMRPHLGPDAFVLTLQNGVDNAERLRALLPQEVASAVVYVASEMAGPGHVVHHGRGELVIARSASSDETARMFVDAGVPTEIADDVRGALWAKLVLNCAYNALSAIPQLPYGRLAQAEGVADVIQDVVRECLAVAKASGVAIPGDIWEAVHGIARTMPSQLSSTAQDLARGRRTEIDHLNGHVMRVGEALGIPTPVNRVLHTLVKLMESSAGGPAA